LIGFAVGLISLAKGEDRIVRRTRLLGAAGRAVCQVTKGRVKA
jgi:hypothetical protein